ncbi:MAG TPA: homoserine dehydrogenase [Clostridia bacterium]|nr:homoserine dehydrogenase [Clostridia bacterium]
MQLPADSREIFIGIIGLGAMGKGLLYQTTVTPRIRALAVCDTDISKACGILREFGLRYRVVENDNDITRAISEHAVAVFSDGEQLAQMRGLDAVVEATGTILPGARFSLAVLNAKKNLILMNSEIDLIFGSYLCRVAEENGVVYTSCDGDQYGVLKHLIDDIKQWGFTLVMAGNIKGYLDRNANPTSIIAEADKRNLDYKACASYTDGTKLNIEMAITANAFGLTTRKAGMFGPKCDMIERVNDCFDFPALWREKQPFVDYVLGAKPGGGVFAIGYCDNPYQMRMLQYYKMGDGPFYTFYRPYHLCHIEAMACIENAVLRHEALMTPAHGFLTNVYAYAKRDLKQGEMLDGIGGYCCYGLVENCADQGDDPGIPICLAEDVRIKRDVKQGEKILLRDVAHDPERLDFKLFALASQQEDKP